MIIKNYKRSLRRKAANFKVEEGRLYYIGNQEKRPGVKQPTDVRRIVVESEEEQSFWYHIRCVGLSSIPRDTELWNCHSCC